MPESNLAATLMRNGKRFGHFERIENMIGSGRPDVNYCVSGIEGNIELKQIERWPAKAETVVEVRHFTPQQRIWIRTRISAGGRVFVLLEVVKPTPLYLLLPGGWAGEHLGKDATATQLGDAALVIAGPRFPIEKIMGAITG